MRTVLFVLFALFNTIAYSQTVITVGPGQDFLTLNQAYASIPATISGPYEIHLMTGYSSFSETFPIVFDARSGSSATNTITIIPQIAGSVISTAAGNTFEFDGCSYVRINGSVSAVGDTANLKVLNTNTNQHAFFFTNGANDNNVSFCDIQGVVAQSGSQDPNGIIRFDDVLSGNTENTFHKNLIHSSGSNTPFNSVHVGANNSANTFSQNYIFDYSLDAFLFSGYSSDWLITGNHFYLGANALYGLGAALDMTDDAEVEFSNNYFGGTEPFATGSPALVRDSYIFRNSSGPSSSFVSDNVVTNIEIDGSFQMFRNLSGTFSGNMIGDTTQTGAITIDLPNAGTFTMFRGLNAMDNVIAGISVSTPGSSTVDIISAYGHVSGNQIGAFGVPNSMNMDCSLFRGVFTPLVAYSNTVSNLTVTGRAKIIQAQSVRNNVVRNCTNQRINQTVLDGLAIAAGSGDSSIACYNNSLSNLVGFEYCITSRAGTQAVSAVSNTLTDVSGVAIHVTGNILRNTIDGVESYDNSGNLITSGGIQSEIGDMEMDSVAYNSVRNIVGGSSSFGIWLEDGLNANASSDPNLGLAVAGNVIENISASDNPSGSAYGIYIEYVEYQPQNALPLNLTDNFIRNIDGRFSNGIYIDSRDASMKDTVANNYVGFVHGRSAAGITNWYGTNGMIARDNVVESIVGGINSVNPGNPGAVGFSCGGAYSEINSNLIQAVYVNGTFATGTTPPITSQQVGVKAFGKVSNCIIRLGIDENGNTLNHDNRIYGILAESDSELYYNTVYVGGDDVDDSNNTYCIWVDDDEVTTSVGNILINARSNSQSGVANHYTYGASDGTVNQSVNFNLHYTSGVGGMLATFDNGTTSVNTLGAMQSAQVGQHLNSWHSDPLLINPVADLTNWNMAPAPGSDAYGNGVYLAQVTEDYYGYTRSFTPTIGAIENSIWVGLNEVPNEIGLLVYPNPASVDLMVDAQGLLIERIEIFNSVGALVYSETVNNSTFNKIDVSELGDGIYLMLVETNEQLLSKKLVIK